MSVTVDLVPAIREGIERHEFELHYQPEVDLAGGEILGMEALVRWHHPTRGVLSPAEFLNVAEDSGLMPALGDWIVEECVREAARWLALPELRRRDCVLWVNVAGAQLSDPAFAQKVIDTIEKYEVPPRLIGIEVPEAALMRLGRAPLEALRTLHAYGVGLAVDDFGTWYSSLDTLHDLPIDAVKLDSRFVRGLGHDLEEDGVVTAVISLAHNRGLRVVAEGVESWAEAARLCELGCDRAHGYLFAGPQRADRARWLLSRGTAWQGGGVDAVPFQRDSIIRRVVNVD